MGAENGDLYMVLIAGSLFLIYAILFFVCDEEYRNNFSSGGHSYADSPEDNVADQWSKAKDQFNQIAAKFEKLKPTNTTVNVSFLDRKLNELQAILKISLKRLCNFLEKKYPKNGV